MEMMIKKEDFADEKSQMIFEQRLKYYTTGNMEHILDMLIEEYYDFARYVVRLKDRICKRLIEFEGNFVIYGAGVHAGYTMDFLKRVGLEKNFPAFA